MSKVRKLRMSGLLLTAVFLVVSCAPNEQEPPEGFAIFISRGGVFTLFSPLTWTIEEGLGSAVEIMAPMTGETACHAQVMVGDEPRFEDLPERLARTRQMVRSMTQGLALISESATNQDGFQRIRLDFTLPGNQGTQRGVWLGVFGKGRVLVLRAAALAAGWDQVAPAIEVIADSLRLLPQ